MSTAGEAREAVAEALSGEGVLPAGWTVYAKPPKAMVAPCVVVGARSPYRVLETYSRERIGLRVSLLMPASADLDDLDAVLETVLPALWEIETLGIDQVTDVGTLGEQESGPAYLSAAIDCWVI